MSKGVDGIGRAEVRGLATALPRYTISAGETKDFLPRVLGPRAAARWQGIVDSSRVEERHVVAPAEQLLERRTLGERSLDYEREAVELGAAAAAGALSAAGVDPSRIRVIVSVSCTGYMLPSLEAHLIGRLGLDPGIRRVPITELGCSGGVAGLAVAADLMSARTDGYGLVLSVEPCSLCLQVEEPTPSDILGGVLFGDGAAAAVLGPPSAAGLRVMASGSVLWPNSLNHLAMRLSTSGYRFVLSSALASVVRTRLRATVQDFLAANALDLRDVGFWVVHPGGPKILESVADALDLTDDQLGASWRVWERHGNLSSATVFFILRELQATSPPPTGALGVMMAFGPGVTCELVLFRADGSFAYS